MTLSDTSSSFFRKRSQLWRRAFIKSGNLIKHPCFDEIRGTEAYRVSGDLMVTDFIMTHAFWVGVYPGMTDEKVDYMAQIIKEAVR